MSSFKWEEAAEMQWNKRAASWTKRSATMWDKGSRKDIIPFIQRYLEKDACLLDIGCGDGYGTYRLHEVGYRTIGMDISSEMISFAKQKATDNTVLFKQGNILDMEESEMTYDSVLAINVMEWTESPLLALQEVWRVLKSNGLFFVGILGPTAGPRVNSYPRLYGEKTICHTIMPWEFMQLAKENSFTYVDGFGVYKKGVIEADIEQLSLPLKQALSFMWVFCFRKDE